MENTGIQPVMPMGGFGDGWMGIFGLLVLLGLLNGNGFGGNGNSNAIQNDINRGFDNQNLQAQSRDIMNASAMNAANVTAAVTNGNASIIREFGTVENALTALAGKQQECCCTLQREIDGVKYANAENTQKVLDAIATNRMADMQNQINQLQLQQAMCGVVRYPLTTSYNAGPYPPTTTAASG